MCFRLFRCKAFTITVPRCCKVLSTNSNNTYLYIFSQSMKNLFLALKISKLTVYCIVCNKTLLWYRHTMLVKWINICFNHSWIFFSWSTYPLWLFDLIYLWMELYHWHANMVYYTLQQGTFNSETIIYSKTLWKFTFDFNNFWLLCNKLPFVYTWLTPTELVSSMWQKHGSFSSHYSKYFPDGLLNDIFYKPEICSSLDVTLLLNMSSIICRLLDI